jgi:isovaleryl-CoA dehydrogenase
MLDGDVVEALARFGGRDDRDPESFPAANLAELYELGIIQAPFPARLGGKGWTLSESVELTEALAAASGSTALVASMPLGLAGIFGGGAALAPEDHRAAWTAQVEQAAADYGQGCLYAACNSEKGAGGSLASITTVAVQGGAGRFLLTGEKILASGGRFAGKFFSTAKVEPVLPGGGAVEFFLVPTAAKGVEILDDWDGFGMRSTESQTVRYADAEAEALLGFPNFIEIVQPVHYFFCLFAALPLGCARAILETMSSPAPRSPALRLRLTEATMRYEALRAYLMETAGLWRYGAPLAYRMRVLRTKTHVTQEATRLAAELFALGGGRNYRRTAPIARSLADSFAGTALRPPLVLGLDTLLENFGTD